MSKNIPEGVTPQKTLWPITKKETRMCSQITSKGRGKASSPEIVQSSEMLTSIAAFTYKLPRETGKRGTRKIKHTLDGREIALRLRCRNRFTPTNEHL